ncbi:MAG: DUF427 domain-containing protein [Pseudomonadota bacterium]
MSKTDVTLAESAIHNPNEPRHFMVVDPAKKTVTVRFGDTVLAKSRQALRLKEVGYKVYDPVLYLPSSAVLAPLTPSKKHTNCPLKGDCEWYSLEMDDGGDIAWSYPTPFDFARAIAGRIAFDASRVVVEEAPL